MVKVFLPASHRIYPPDCTLIPLRPTSDDAEETPLRVFKILLKVSDDEMLWHGMVQFNKDSVFDVQLTVKATLKKLQKTSFFAIVKVLHKRLLFEFLCWESNNRKMPQVLFSFNSILPITLFSQRMLSINARSN